MNIKSNAYLPPIDGLRAISIILVYFEHVLWFSGLTTTNKFVPGSYGVTVFFFISGFLITRLLLTEAARTNHIDLKRFYIRRFLRLYPSLLVFLLVITVFTFFVLHLISYPELMSGLFYYENYYQLYAKNSTAYYGVLWSLSVEEHFYLFYPLLFLVFFRRPKRLLASVTILMVIELVVRCITAVHFHASERSHYLIYQLSHFRFDSIFFGCLSALLLNGNFSNGYLKLSSNRYLYILALIAVPFSLVFPNAFFKQTFRYTVQGLSLMILIPPILYNVSYSWLNRLLSLKPMVFVGKISYSIYLFHFVVLIVLGRFTFKDPMSYIETNITLSAMFSLAAYYGIERPFFAIRRNFGSHVKEKIVTNSLPETNMMVV